MLVVDGPDDVAGAWGQIGALGCERVIVEEYLSGPDYSVESFTFGGRHGAGTCLRPGCVRWRAGAAAAEQIEVQRHAAGNRRPP